MMHDAFVNHIRSLKEYKDLRARRKSIAENKFTVDVVFPTVVLLHWGINEPDEGDIERDFLIHDNDRRVFSDPAVKKKVAEHKASVKAYLKDMKALVRREAKKAGIPLTAESLDEDAPDLVVSLEDVMFDIA